MLHLPDIELLSGGKLGCLSGFFLDHFDDIFQHFGDRRSWIRHAGDVRLGERLLHIWNLGSAVGLLHVEVHAQGRG